MRQSVVPILLTLRACSGGGAPQDPKAVQADDVAGRWDVVSFGGYDVPQRMDGTSPATTVDFREDAVGLRLECNWSGSAGYVRDGRFISTQDGPTDQTLMGCKAEKSERDGKFFGFFAKSPLVERLPEDRLRLVAGEEELVIQRPEVRRLQFVPDARELQGKWRMEGVAMYAPDGSSGGTLFDVPGRIVIGPDSIGYNRCPQYDMTYRMTDDGRLEKTGGAELPDAPADCPDLADDAYGTRAGRWAVGGDASAAQRPEGRAHQRHDLPDRRHDRRDADAEAVRHAAAIGRSLAHVGRGLCLSRVRVKSSRPVRGGQSSPACPCRARAR